MHLKHAIAVLCLAALTVGQLPTHGQQQPTVTKAEEELAKETARFSIIDEFEKLTSGTRSLFSDMNALRNSPVMQSLISRLMQRGSYMTQQPVEKKQIVNKTPVVQRVQNVAPDKPVAAIQAAPATENKKSNVADKTKVADDPSKYFKMGDMTLAGAMGLGALALGALIASPVVGAGILSRSDDDPNVASKKSWLDSLAFWKEDQDGEPFYEVPVVVNKGQDQYYNPYHDLGDGTGYDPSIIKYEDDEDFYGDYNDEGTRLDKNSHKKSYYSNYAAEEARQDKPKKKTYYSDEDFWNDHYYKDGVIYERGSNIASPYSYQGATGYGYYDSKKRGVKKPYSRSTSDYSGDYGSASEGSYDVYDGYAIRDHGERHYEGEDKEKVYVTVNEINKIANESLKDLLKQYQRYLRRVDGQNIVYADAGAEDYAEAPSRGRAPVYNDRIGGGGGSDWQPLEMYGGDWNSEGDTDNLKNHRIPSSESAKDRGFNERLTQQQPNKPKPKIRRPQQAPKMEPSQPDYEYQRNANPGRLIYASPQVETTSPPAAVPPRRKLTRKTKSPELETTTEKVRNTRESNISKSPPNEKEVFEADALVKELTEYQKAYARRFGSR